MCCLYFQGYTPVTVGSPRADNHDMHRPTTGSPPRQNLAVEVLQLSNYEYLNATN